MLNKSKSGIHKCDLIHCILYFVTLYFNCMQAFGHFFAK